MARILVTGAHETLAERRLLAAITQRMRRDGHDAVQFAQQADAAAEARDADAVVAVLDKAPTEAVALVAYAHAAGKPVLGFATKGLPVPTFLADIAQVVSADDEASWLAALPAYYDKVRPFAGRLVRDRIPELVEQAGHDVKFRQLTADEKPRFLKQKIATEAKELLEADIGREKEEVSDLLEAMEAFITARGLERDDLRRVKEHKRKQRGGFERCFVVESTSGGQEPAEPAGAATRSAEPGATTTPRAHVAPAQASKAAPPAAPVDEPTTHADVVSGDAVDFDYENAPEEPVEAPDDLTPGRRVKPEFFEI